ncbi:redox-sensing transcriptional repressor Rex [Microlunatus flavus]|uniref:Redox-sensing transcriptional repressor Rex n=1 Tax=Microlunatus flavus TaxID=1036181 RepID=A0A1H8Z839_9ACTN|nr:redox-sensing transcriptional repressor Rex [Microlunatus flavus]SEP59768.1 redox-sensing transcriptional repressor [Microlunatus flavus]
MISDLLPGPGAGTRPARGVPSATVARLPVYHEALQRLFAGHVEVVSSAALAEAAGVSPSQLRKDLSCLGTYGTRGVGYDVARLQRQIATHIGAASEWPVVVVGVGHLGTALANYAGFAARGFRLVALVDPAPERVGTTIQGIEVSDLADLEEVVRNTGAVIAVIATPAEAAQDVTDRLVHQGVTSILNFASTALVVPEGVNVRKVDLGQELAILAFHEQRKVEEAV